MSITIRTSADSPNLANNRLVYNISSTNTGQPQFKIVLDINDRDGNQLQRIKQQVNKSNAAVFDIGQIITTYLGPTDNVWTTATDNTPSLNAFCADQFQIRFGEEWALSSTGSTGIYTGLSPDTGGEPAVSASHYNYFIDGTQDPNTPGFDWDYATKYDEEDTYGTTTFNHQNGLTNFPATQSVRLGDYHTISILNGNVEGVFSASLDPSLAQDIYAMTLRQYDSSNSLLATNVFYNLSGPRSVSTQLWDDVYQNQTYRTQLLHWGVGPQNIEDGAVSLNANTSYYTVTFNPQTPEPGVNTNGVFGEYRFNIKDAACDYPGTRFAWKNEYGVWDYFNFELATSTISEVERESYEQNFVDYGTTFAAGWDAARRGQQQFQNRVSKLHTAESNFLNQTDADNLRELFYSTNVYIFNPDGSLLDGNYWLPVVIENASVTEKTNPRNQKLFRYTVQYRYANDLQPRV